MTDSLGEKLYEYELNITGITEYGASLQAVLAGDAPPPPSGLRVDVAFEGTATGKISGTVRGVDYLNFRADGRSELDIKATITTADGELIALAADGVATPQPGSPLIRLRENATLTTASPAYGWVNALQVWGVGTVDLGAGKIVVRGYADIA
ncbi:MAG: DUF3237 domain-containing protein [Acidimicrobiia bacterium]|nr:DUF3237 domain-containing protein [Acidimicrobiia bacterium]